MKRLLNVFSIFVLTLAAFFAVFMNVSCEVGLGASVDTYPPSLSVEYPSGDSLVIRDTFVMKGKSNDETSIASVTINFVPTESSTAPASFSITYNANFEPRGTEWDCTINNKVNGEYEIPDGEYKVTVLATDSAARSTTVTRVYKIDNTAPLVVIKRPANNDSYGRTLKITGDISDENTLGTLTFTPYRKNGDVFEQVTYNGSPVTFTQNNVSGNGLEVIVARWYDNPATEDESRQNTFYRAMFASENVNDKKEIYYTVKVNDTAVSYTGNTPDETGNVSEVFYIYDDIYADIYSDTSSDGVHLGLTNKQLIQILNGNDTSTEALIAKEKLHEKQYLTAPVEDESGDLTFPDAVKFSISPNSSPSYTVGGYEYKNEGSTQTSITNDGVMNITVTRGADQHSLKADTIRVAMVEATLNNTTKKLEEKSGVSEIVIIEAPEKYNDAGYTGGKTPAYWNSVREEAMKIGDNITINVKTGLLTAGAHYLVKVEGRDAENIPVEPEGGKQFGFIISQNSQPPVVSIESSYAYSTETSSYSTAIANNSDIPDAKIKINGKVSVETKQASLDYKITVTDGSGTSSTAIYSKEATIFDDTASGTNTKWATSEKEWSWTVPTEVVNAIKALDNAASPSYTKGLYLMTVAFDATSSSGLSTANSMTRTFYVDTSAPEITDVIISPVVTYDEAIDSFEADKDYVNGIISIKANVNDNHTVMETIYSVKAGTQELQSGRLTGNIIRINDLNTASQASYDKKDLTVEFTPVDKAGNKGTKVTKTVSIDQDTDKPVIKLTNADKTISSSADVNKDHNLFDLVTNNKILGSVSDDDKLDEISVQWKKADADDSTYAYLYGFPKVTAKSTEAITVQFINKADNKKLSEGLYKLKIVAKDEHDASGSAEFYVAIDDNDPSLTITSESNQFQTGTVTVHGKVQDSSNKITVTSPKNGVIGIYEVSNVSASNATVTKKLTAGGTPVTLTKGTDFTVSNSVVTINWEDSFTCATGGETISYTAEDKYGKTSEAQYSYKEDQVAPVVSITSPTAPVFLGSTLTSFQKFTGTASDGTNGSGIASIEYKFGVPASDTIQLVGENWAVVDASKASVWLNSGWQTANGTESWNLNLDCSTGYADGAYVWFRAVDVAGNKTAIGNIKSVSVTMDTDVPEITFIKVTSGGTEISAVSNVYYVKSAELKITGKVAETYVPVSAGGVQQCLSVDNTDGTLNTTAISTGLDFTYTIASSNLAKGQKSLRFTARDKAGQTSSEAITIFVDKDAPNVEISSITPQVNANGKENNVNGTIAITGNASDDDKVSKTILYINDAPVTDSNGAVLSDYTTKVTKVNYSDGGTRFSYTVDTTKWTNGTDLTVMVETTDRSGNVSAENVYDAASESSYNKKVLYIDQSTDVPTLSSSNMNLSLASSPSSEDGGNLYGMGSQTVYVTASDDDGVALFTYKIDTGAVTTLYTGSSTSVTKSITFPNTLTGAHTITFVVKDINGKEYTPAAVNFAIDNDVPVISEIKIAGKTYEKDMFVPRQFIITGKSEDASGVALVTLEGVPSGTTSSGTTTWTSSEITETEGTKSVVVTAKDVYGRASTTTLEFKVDITSPVWKQTASGEDVPTTIKGGQKEITNTELASLTTPFWFNSDSITLSGKAYDANGVAGYTLKVNGDSELTANGGGSYSIIASYVQGANTAVLKAKDTAGNETSRTININVDTVAPEVEQASITVDGASGSTLYIKSGSNVVVTVKAKDVTSGVSKILIGKTPSFAPANKIAEIDLSSVVATANSKTGTVDISDACQLWAEGTNTIYIRAVDAAGLDSSETSITGLVVDKTAPAVEYTSHSTNEVVNKLVTLSGTYVEVNKAASPDAKLYYRENGTSSWTASSKTVTVNSDGTWSVTDFNTQDSSITDGKSYDFQIRLKDAAGNETPATSSFLTLEVSQDSDRPVIKLNFATDGHARLNSGIFAGTISDDDGAVTSLEIQAVPQGEELDAANWVTLTVTGGSWEISEDDKLSDDTYSLYFRVVDSKNATFVTDGTDSLTVPYIQYSTSTAVCGPVSFSVDTTPPTLTLVDVSLTSTTTAADTYSGASIQNNKVLGGVSYRYAKFKINASDSVSKGSDLSVKVSFADTDYTAEYNSSDKYYYTDRIDLNGVESGIYQLTVTSSDQANMAKTFTKMVIIDNSAPDTIKNVTPSATTEVTGDFTLSGLVQDDEDANSGLPASGTAMWYYIPKYSERNTTGADALAALGWTTENFTRSSVSWNLEFSNLAQTIGYDSSTENVGENYRGYVVTGNSALYDIPVWFKVMDNAGNIGYIRDNVIHYNPNADKPHVEITYPGESEKENGKIVMGGTARFQGTASDNEGIEGVYLQFDMDGNGTWENGSGVTGVQVNSSGKVYVGGDKTNVAVLIPNTSDYGFKAKGTLTWSSFIDLSGITGANKKFKVRAIAVDSDSASPLVSAWTDVIEIDINNEIPQIEDLYLVQYEEAAYTTFKQQIKYEEDVFISGSNWRLEGMAKHKDGIASVTIDAANTVTSQDSTDENDKVQKVFQIPVNPEGKVSGSWSATITATDKGSTPHPKMQVVSVNIDNLAPSFADGEDEDELVLYKDAYGIDANKLSSSVTIQNSNGTYASISSRLVESGSGFAQAVFYFERTGSEHRVYNVMKNCGDDRTANKATVVASKTDGKVYINADGLPVLYKASVGRSSKTSIELTTNDNIRSYGLVKIGGAYHKIAGVTATAVTLADEVDTKFNTNVEFVYGMVVDHSGESRDNSGTLKADDGDGMVESYSKSGSNYTWDVEIPSANIPDGPINVHVVLFDKAGNIKHGSVATRLTNNAPRITSVKLGTDLNGNGSYSNDEYEKFYALQSHSTSSGVDIWNLDTKKEMGTAKNWTAKNKLSVVPEFVGGTAPFKYVFTTSGASAVNLTAPVKTTDTSKKKGDLTVVSTDETTGAVTMNAIEISNTEIGTTGEGKDVTYQFSFWDSTEETTAGVNSSWTVLNAQVRQVLDDSNPPVGYIRPFYWNAENDNSLMDNSRNNGHIELEKDWETSGSMTGTTGEYDSDPKVSGKIVLRGLIYDDVRLKSLGVTFADFGTITVSSFSDGAWSAYTDASSGKIPSATVNTVSIGQSGHLARYEIVVDTSLISGKAGTDKAITITVKDSKDNTFTSAATDGKTSDTVTATYYANASQVKECKFYPTLADAKAETAGAAVTVDNPDMTLNKLEEAEEGTGFYKYTKHSRTGYYRVDVVPYITKLSTGISETAGDHFARSASGKYVVRGSYLTGKKGNWTEKTETVGLFGFNLEANSTNGNVKIGSTSGLKTTFVAETTKNGKVIPAHLTFPVGTATTSGKLSITVNNVESLNNKNKNPALEAGETAPTDNSTALYNSQANNKNNNRLTDDIDILVWGMNYFLDKTNITSPMLKMDDTGSYYMSYGNEVNYMYVNKDGTERSVDGSYNKFHNTNVIYDGNGNLYAVATNTDRVDDTSSRFAFYTPYATTQSNNLPTSITAKNAEYQTPRNSKRHLELAFNGKTGIYDINRVKLPKLTSSTNGARTYIAMSYYDSNNEINPVKFRYGYREGQTISGGISGSIKAISQNPATGQSNNPDTTDCSYKDYHIVASDEMTFKGGQYTATGILPVKNASGVVTSYVGVVAWYDASARRVCYSYNTAPGTPTAASNSQWQQHAVYLDGEYTGWYVDLAVDGNNGIHISYYDSAQGDLKYAYIPKYDGVTKDSEGALVSGATVRIVDSYLSVGTNISINTRLEGENYVPYIYYYNASSSQTSNSIKVAWRSDFSELRHGAVDDLYTGSWESMTIPSANIPVEATVCGGVPLNGDYSDSVVLGYMTDAFYEKAVLK